MSCNCDKKDRRNWRVVQWFCNHSAFNGYRQTPSAYSEIRCLACGRGWRTKAAYVNTLAIYDEKELTPWLTQ